MARRGGDAERVLPLVDRMLASAGWTLGSLDAIAFGRGPGAFTGVRIAVSTVQGLALGSGLPVVPVSDLAAVGQRLLGHVEVGEVDCALVCLDARMGELYAAVVAREAGGGVNLLMERLVRPADIDARVLPGIGRVVAGGHGFSAHPDLAGRFGGRIVAIHAECLPHAEDIVRLAALDVAAGRVLDAAQAQPVYLRDDVATKSGPRL